MEYKSILITIFELFFIIIQIIISIYFGSISSFVAFLHDLVHLWISQIQFLFELSSYHLIIRIPLVSNSKPSSILSSVNVVVNENYCNPSRLVILSNKFRMFIRMKTTRIVGNMILKLSPNNGTMLIWPNKWLNSVLLISKIYKQL